MKYICIISHEQPGPDGGFRRYEAGTIYEMDKPDEALFRAVHGLEEDKPRMPLRH